MEKNIKNISELFKLILAEQLTAEKKYLKIFQKLSKSIVTDELKSAISPDATAIQDHLSRLSRALATVKHKQQAKLSPVDEELLNGINTTITVNRGQSLLKDIHLLHALKMIFNIKVARYDSLYLMAAALGEEEHSIVLEQCSKDNRNTSSYLDQIAQNIIYPSAAKQTTTSE